MTPGQGWTCFNALHQSFMNFTSPEPKAHKVSLYGTRPAGVCLCVCPGEPASVCVCVHPCVKTFRNEYLCNQTTDRNHILSEASLAHLSRRLRGELIVYQSSRRPSVRALVCASTFSNMNISRDQQADRNQILSEASLGWGKGCIRFWARSDRNSGVHGNG